MQSVGWVRDPHDGRGVPKAALTGLPDGRWPVFNSGTEETTMRPRRRAPLLPLALYSLIVTPNVSSFGDLRGKLLAIGGPRDGPTTILRRLLRANDLRDDDTEFVAVGGTPERMAAIMSGAVAGSLLAQPYDLMA